MSAKLIHSSENIKKKKTSLRVCTLQRDKQLIFKLFIIFFYLYHRNESLIYYKAGILCQKKRSRAYFEVSEIKTRYDILCQTTIFLLDIYLLLLLRIIICVLLIFI